METLDISDLSTAQSQSEIIFGELEHQQNSQNSICFMKEKKTICQILSIQPSVENLECSSSNDLEISITQKNQNQNQQFIKNSSLTEGIIQSDHSDKNQIKEKKTNIILIKRKNCQTSSIYDLENKVIIFCLGPDENIDVQCIILNILNELLKQCIKFCEIESPYDYPKYEKQKYFAKLDYSVNLKLIPKIQKEILNPIKNHIFNCAIKKESNIDQVYENTIKLVKNLNLKQLN